MYSSVTSYVKNQNRPCGHYRYSSLTPKLAAFSLVRAFAVQLTPTPQFAGKILSRTLSALSRSLVYLNLSHNAFEGVLPLAALSPYSASETAASSRGSDSGSTSEGHKSRSERRIEAAAGMVLSSLSYVNLSNNRLTGRISKDVGELTSLETMDLSHNKLEGEIPPEIGNCVALRVLSLSRCGLSGRLDGITGKELGRLHLLETLRLDGNTFEGTAPASFGYLTRLEVLQLQVCCKKSHTRSCLCIRRKATRGALRSRKKDCINH